VGVAARELRRDKRFLGRRSFWMTVYNTSSYKVIICNEAVTFTVVTSNVHNTFCRRELLGKGTVACESCIWHKRYPAVFVFRTDSYYRISFQNSIYALKYCCFSRRSSDTNYNIHSNINVRLGICCYCTNVMKVCRWQWKTPVFISLLLCCVCLCENTLF